jgi:8-oxo-dGTP pyrophosphatase MutT (NUDIX family)
MKRGETRLTGQPSARGFAPPGRYLPLAHLRSLKGTTQVAAVCYRYNKGVIEFLLVETRGGRWTFPKGSAEPGLTHAQAAALEAFEEAGVHGRIEEASFASYSRPAPGNVRSHRSPVVVHAHLCEVTWLDAPQEADRNPTWFTADKAKRRLRDDRSREFSNELARMVDEAVRRIRKPRMLSPAYPQRKHQVIDIASARMTGARPLKPTRPLP